jgi:adenylosuccinate synthase
MLRVDVVVDLQYGDCGKGKVTHHLARIKDYTHVLRYNGGCNAGYTIFHKGQKFITHCPAAAPMRQKGRVEEGRISGPS